jgi:hypothetical protein
VKRSNRNRLVAGGAGILVVVFAAAALAQSGGLSPRDESEAVISDAAEQLGVEPSELSDALKQALKNRIDAAVEAGRLTEEHGAEMKEWIDAGEVPLLGLAPGHHGVGHAVHFGGLDAAASYLGMSEEDLRSSLADGKTLAEVAREKNKAVDGLVDAMVASAKQDLDQAVEDGRLTGAQRDRILSGIEERITAKVNGEFLGGPHMHGPGPWGPPAPGGSSDGPGPGSSGASAGVETTLA